MGEHIQKNLLDLAQVAAQAKGIEETWMTEYRNAFKPAKKATKETPKDTTKETTGVPGCKWCKRGECWDHQNVEKKSSSHEEDDEQDAIGNPQMFMRMAVA